MSVAFHFLMASNLLFYSSRVNYAKGESEFSIVVFNFATKEVELLECLNERKGTCIPFSHMKQVLNQKNFVIVLYLSEGLMYVMINVHQGANGNRAQAKLFPHTSQDKDDIYRISDTICNVQNQIEGERTLSNLYELLKPKISLRCEKVTKCKIHVQIQRERNRVAMISSDGHKEAYVMLTKRHIYCFHNESEPYPFFVFPNLELKWDTNSNKVSFRSTTSKERGSFYVEDCDSASLWLRATEKTICIHSSELVHIGAIVKNLAARYTTKFDPAVPAHVELLRRLWDASGIGEIGEKVEFNIKHERWKILGFQRDEPASDYRGSGLLGLESMVHFAESYNPIFLRIVQEQLRQETEMYYPFATAAINITTLLAKALHFSKRCVPCSGLPTFPLFFKNYCEWEDLFTLTIQMFDTNWQQMQVGYMGFQQVKEKTEIGLIEVIKRRAAPEKKKIALINSPANIPIPSTPRGDVTASAETIKFRARFGPVRRSRRNTLTDIYPVQRGFAVSDLSGYSEKRKSCQLDSSELSLDTIQ